LSGVVELIREPIFYFVGLYKIELLIFGLIVATVYYVYTNGKKFIEASNNEL